MENFEFGTYLSDQTSYARPLSDMVLMNTNMVKEKTIKTVHHPQRNVAENLMRPRNKIKLSDVSSTDHLLLLLLPLLKI